MYVQLVKKLTNIWPASLTPQHNMYRHYRDIAKAWEDHQEWFHKKRKGEDKACTTISAILFHETNKWILAMTGF